MKGVGFKTRGAFLRKSGPPNDPDRMHLHFICTDEDQFGTLLVVPLCTLEPHIKDRACVLGIGDHPFINRRSFIHYGKAEILDVSALQEALSRGDIVPHDDCSQATFDLIAEGINVSKAIRPKKADYFKGMSRPFPRAA